MEKIFNNKIKKILEELELECTSPNDTELFLAELNSIMKQHSNSGNLAK